VTQPKDAAGRTLIVARMKPVDADAVARIFAESDATELPRMLGVTRRTLFRFHELYFHLIEAEQDILSGLDEVRAHPLFQDVNVKLAQYMRPYDPSWLEPKDSMAVPFYRWMRS
jgi:cyclase